MTDTAFTDRDRILGCWLGKAIGGTLGAPYEGSAGPHKLDFYNPVPTTMLPNDDLDLQVLWACQLASGWKGVVSLANFADTWLHDVAFPWDEYGVLIRNLRLGIPAPYSGKYDNWFVDGEGAAIRSELWAVLAPRDPQRAAKLARMDGCLDHDGEGLHAICFLAALESEAFSGIGDPRALIERGLRQIPAESRLAHAIRDTVAWVEDGLEAEPLRLRILESYGNPNFTDVCMNTAFVIAALLLGQGDFGRTICTAVNFGQDADCTGATAGAIMGLINPAGIPERWLAPIGRSLVLSKEITGITPPPDLDAFTDMLLGLRDKITIDDTVPPPPDWSRFTIPAQRLVLASWITADLSKLPPDFDGGDSETIALPGNLFEVDFTALPSGAMVMYKVKFRLPESQMVHIVVNTPARSRVWLDGEYAFGRDGGDMVPAFHRPQLNQFVHKFLEAGEHTLVFGLVPTDFQMHAAPVLFGFAAADNQWLAGIER